MKVKQYHESNQGPLAGIRILDFTMLLPGPICTMYLGDLGAEVIKVEHPNAWDTTRKMGSFLPNSKISSYYYFLNRNKKSISINFKKKEGVEILKKIIPTVDVVVEGFRPMMMQELGLGYEDLKDIKPDLIYCSISGYGQNSKFREFAGHDANYLALSGILDLIGDTKPVLPAIQIADILGGTMTALSSILVALFYKEKTKKGQYLDISIKDSVLPVAFLSIADLISSGKEIQRNETYLSGKLPNYNLYECKDGRFVVLAALEGQFFSVFLKQIGRSDLLQKTLDGKFEEVKKELADFFKEKTYKDLEFLFENPNCCLTPVLTLKEALENVDLLNRETIIQINDKEVGTIKMLFSPFAFSKEFVHLRLPPPKLGEHTKSILSEFYSDKELSNLESKKIIYSCEDSKTEA